MECVKDKNEARSLPSEEIFTRLLSLYDEMVHSTDRLPKEYVESLPESTRRLHMVFTANKERLSNDEIRSANIYLSETLSNIKKKYLGKKKQPPYEATQAAAWGYEILSSFVPKRRYQEALILWLWSSPAFEGRRIHIPKETEDVEITIALANAIAPKLDGTAKTVPQILAQVIAESKSCGNETLHTKASILLEHTRQALANYEREQDLKRRDEKLIERMANRLRHGEYGKVTVRNGYIELNTKDPNFTFNPKALQVEPNGGKFGKRSSLIAIQTKIVADEMGFNNADFELLPVISSSSDGIVKLEFQFVKKLKK